MSRLPRLAVAILGLLVRDRTAREAQAPPRAHRRETESMDALRQDLRFTWRSARARPGFSALVIVTLALGIGANTAIFSLVNGLLLEPLPYEEAERLVLINQATPEGFTASVSLPNYRDWKERAESFDRFSAILPGSATLSRPDGGRVVESAWVHGGFFETLGVDPLLGRVFSEGESEPGTADAVVVVGHALWSSELGSDPAVIGSTIRLNDEPWTVVGVMPPGFEPYGGVLLYRPMGRVADRIAWNDRNTGSGTEVLARLAPGVDPDEAQAELEAVAAEVRAEVGGDVGIGNLTTLREWYLGDVDRQVLLLMIAVGFVLLVACGNVANLLLVRGEGRRAEIALRAALGAGRHRLHRQLLTESMAYGVAGGLAGAALGAAGLQALLRTAGATLPPSFVDRIGVDGSVLLFTAAVALATAVVAGFVPAWRAARLGLADTLRSSTRTGGARGRASRALVAAEVGLSMVLLVGAGLLIRSLSNLQRVDTGFDASGVLTLRVLSDRDLPSRDAWAAYHGALRERVGSLPGVAAAATSQIFPLSGSSWEMLLHDETTPAEDRGESVLLTMVSPEYFEVYGVDIVEGRGFTEADRWGDDLVAVVDETLARSRWPGERATGKRISFEETSEPDGRTVRLWRTVVGVAEHVRHYELASPSRIEVYTPLAQYRQWGFTCYLSLRAGGDLATLVPAVRAAVADLDPGAAIYRIRTVESLMDEELGIPRALRELFTLFAALTLLLGAVGIYGVVSHATAMRVREMGVRLALGDAPSRLVGRVVLGSLAPVGIGLAAGLVASLGLARLLGAFLYEVRPLEPGVLAAAAGLLLLTAVGSASLPALRAARVDPTTALRAE